MCFWLQSCFWVRTDDRKGLEKYHASLKAPCFMHILRIRYISVLLKGRSPARFSRQRWKLCDGSSLKHHKKCHPWNLDVADVVFVEDSWDVLPPFRVWYPKSHPWGLLHAHHHRHGSCPKHWPFPHKDGQTCKWSKNNFMDWWECALSNMRRYPESRDIPFWRVSLSFWDT